MEKRPLLLCTDPGIDDFIALSMVLARPEFDVLGMIALSGNVGLDVTVNNALLACELNGRSDIPVLAGSAKPLARPARSASVGCCTVSEALWEGSSCFAGDSRFTCPTTAITAPTTSSSTHTMRMYSPLRLI